MTGNVITLRRPEERVRTRNRGEALSLLHPRLMTFYEQAPDMICLRNGEPASDVYRAVNVGSLSLFFGWLNGELYTQVKQGRALLMSATLVPHMEARTWKRGAWES